MSSAADPVARIAAAMDAAMSDPNSTIPVPLKPPAAWFREVPEWHVPPPEGPLVQIDMESGRVAALVAPYGECILDGRQGCWTPGMSKTNYEYAHVGSIVTAEGETIRTANVGGGINHFDTSLATAASLAADHYANTATRRMYGRYMDVPDVGIMFVGSMYPGSTYLHAFEAMTSALSGDWRWIESLRDHEMVGSQLVNNPGFRPNPLNRRPVLASVSFRSAGAKVASATDCDGVATIISEWEPVVIDDTPDYAERLATIEAVTAALMLDAVEDAPMLPEGFDEPLDPVDIMDLDDDGDEGEDWTEEFADLTNDECHGCRGVGCQRCGWIGYTGPDDEAVVAALRANEAIVAKLVRRRDKARDGDGDGFVYDGTPRQRPAIPGFDIIGENVSLDIIKRAASGDARARKQVMDRAAQNAELQRKRGEAPTAKSLAEATLGPRPKARSDRSAWDELARDVGAVSGDDPDRIPGGRNPMEGRTPRTPTEVDIDRAAKARAQGRGRVTRAEARRSRGGRDADGTPADAAPVLRAPNGRPIDTAKRDQLTAEYRRILALPMSNEVDKMERQTAKKLRDMGVDPEELKADPDTLRSVAEARLPSGTEYAYSGDGPVPFAVSKLALDVIKGTRGNEADGDRLALLVEAPEGGRPSARFVPVESIDDSFLSVDLDGVTVATPAADAPRVRGKRLESPTWGSGVVLSEADMPSAEDADALGDELPSKMKLSADRERFKGWSNDRLTGRLAELDELIANGGGRQPGGSSPRNEFARRAAEREFIAAELDARGIDPDSVRPERQTLAEQTLDERVIADGGFTYDPGTGTFPEEGIAVAVPGHSMIATREAFEADPQRFIADYLRQMRDDGVEDLMIGGWYDEANDEVVLDRVQVVADRDEAIRLGADRDEQAVYDLATGEEIPTGGTGGRDSIDIIGQEAAGDGAPGQARQGPDGRGNRPDRSGSGGEGDRGPAGEVANPFTERLEGGEAGGPVGDLMERARDLARRMQPQAMPDTTGRNSASPDVPEAGEGGTPVDSIPGGGTPRPQLRRTRDRGPATPGVSNVDRTNRNPGAPEAPTPAEVQMARGVPEAEAIEATRPPRPRAIRQPSIGRDQREAGEQWREDRGLLSPGFGPAYLGDSYPGEPGATGQTVVEWDPRAGTYVRTTATGAPSPVDVDRQRAELEALTASLPSPDTPAGADARADALNEVLRGVGKRFPLLTTKGLHNQRGESGKEWSAERRAVHDELLMEVTDRILAAGVPADRMALFTGGLPGSGKSFALKPGQKAEDLKAVVWELSDPNPPKVPEGFTLYVAVNSDYIKERMAELGLNTGIAGLKPMEEASLMHSESSYVGERLEGWLTSLGFNVAFDGTMGNEGKMRKKMQRIEDLGYAKPKLVFADITVAESEASAAARYRRGAASELGGRFVPSDVAEDNVSRMANLSMNRDTANYLINEGLVAEAVIVDNRGVSNSSAKTVADLDLNFPIPQFKADELGLRYSDTPNPDGTFNVLDPELGGAVVKADFGRVDGRVADSKWTEFAGVKNPPIGPEGYPARPVERVLAMPGVKGGTGTEDDPFDVDDVNTAAILLAEGEYQIKLDRQDEVGTLMDRLKELVDEAKKQGRKAPTYDLCNVTVPDVNLFCAENIGYDRIQMPQLGTLAPVPGSVADQILAVEQVSAFLAGRKVPDEVNLAGYFMDHLRSRGIEVEVVQTPAKRLKASQRELNGAKVAGMVDWKERAQAAAPKIDKLNKRLDAGELTPAEYIAEARKTTANVPDGGTEAELVAAIRPQAVWTPRRIITTSDDYIVDGHHGWASDVAIDYAEGEEVMVESYQIKAPIVQVLAVAKEWAEAMGSPAQGAGGYGPDGLTDDIRRYRRSRRRTRVPSGGGPVAFPTTTSPITPLVPGGEGAVAPAVEAPVEAAGDAGAPVAAV